MGTWLGRDPEGTSWLQNRTRRAANWVHRQHDFSIHPDLEQGQANERQSPCSGQSVNQQLGPPVASALVSGHGDTQGRGRVPGVSEFPGDRSGH